MSIATKTGDDGTTALMFGRRVPKTDPRIEACGSVDELCAALGSARAAIEDVAVDSAILAIQKELVLLMGEIAVTDEDRARYAEKGYKVIQREMVDRLTRNINDAEEILGKFTDWSMPGGTSAGAAFDLARTVCRRAERRVIDVAITNPQMVPYLNRLSDFCWLLARLFESDAESQSRFTALLTNGKDESGT